MKIFELSFFLFFIGLLFSTSIKAQYPPPAGQPGTTAMYMDSLAFVSWASTCKIERGFINMADTNFLYNGNNKATYGSYLLGSGPADGLVVSLGDNGTALLTFDIPIVDRPGPDFAVFENSFSDSFLELAFVEVSSDGIRFVRFPAVSLTSENEQVGTFGLVDATKINNLAGKYRQGFGTPFDLTDIKDSSGIDLNHISQIRIVDVGGCIQTPYSTFDSQGNIVNDPWPTPFDTGGFDLDAIGVIHNKTQGTNNLSDMSSVCIYPNPVINKVTFDSHLFNCVNFKITDIEGNVLIESEISRLATLDMSSFPAGIYLASFSLKDGNSITKKIIKYQTSQ
ncbi:MAG: T9SS type A sorting domain-containing protein [Bacteroidota bacterium]